MSKFVKPVLREIIKPPLYFPINSVLTSKWLHGLKTLMDSMTTKPKITNSTSKTSK